MEVGAEGDYNLLLHCHHQNDSCIRMGSDESHFNVSLIVRDKVIRQCPQTTTCFEEKGEPKRYRTEVILLTSLTAGQHRLSDSYVELLTLNGNCADDRNVSCATTSSRWLAVGFNLIACHADELKLLVDRVEQLGGML